MFRPPPCLRAWLCAICVAVAAFCSAAPASRAEDWSASLRAGLLHDPASWVLGNPDGSITIVEFFDYRCINCRAMQSILRALLTGDHHVRLVLKEWPIFGGVSIYAADVAIAAGFQGRYLAVHDALFTVTGMTEAKVLDAAAHAGADMARLHHDLAARAGDIAAIIGNNEEQARALALQGTPGLVIGTEVVSGALSLQDLEARIHEQSSGGATAD